MLNNLIEGHAILANLIATIPCLYRFARRVLSKIRLSSVSYRLDTDLLIEIYIEDNDKLIKPPNFKQQEKYLALINEGGGYNLFISKI